MRGLAAVGHCSDGALDRRRGRSLGSASGLTASYDPWRYLARLYDVRDDAIDTGILRGVLGATRPGADQAASGRRCSWLAGGRAGLAGVLPSLPGDDIAVLGRLVLTRHAGPGSAGRDPRKGAAAVVNDRAWDASDMVIGQTTPSPVEEQLQNLLSAGLDGDVRAYRMFLEELTKRLRAFLRRRLFDMHDHVEDIVQETLLAVHNARHTYRRGQPVTAWVYAIARYKLMDFLRARMRHDALNDPLGDAANLFEESAEQASDARRDIAALLEALPDRQRLPIEMVKLQGLSVAETANCIGMSESAVKVGVHRGLKALAVRIRGES